jgi:hypothetical protein
MNRKNWIRYLKKECPLGLDILNTVFPNTLGCSLRMRDQDSEQQKITGQITACILIL